MLRSNLSVVAAMLIALTSASASAQSPERLQLDGRFQTVVACHLDQGVSFDEHAIITDDGTRHILRFAPRADIPRPGSRITLTGRLIRGVVLVDSFFQTIEPLSGGSSIGEQKICVLLINFQDDTTQNVTKERVAEVLFTPGDSADRFWRDASFEKMWITGDVFGWYTLPVNRDCDPALWRSLAIEAADPDVYFPDYNRLFLLMPQGGACGWGGLGTLGFDTFTTDDGPWTTTTSWCRSEYYNDLTTAIEITTHEGGHNLGQHHARAIRFDGGALGQFDCLACGSEVSEYGDRFDTLGLWNLGMYNTRHKMNLGWFNPDNIITVTNGGTFAIDPFSLNTNEPKVLEIFRGHGQQTNRDEWLYAEWRQPIGYDQYVNWLGGQHFNGLLMHYDWGDDATATYLLDMTPGDDEWLNGSLQAGTMWTDDDTDLSIEAIGIDQDVMNVEVRFAADLVDVAVENGSLLGGGVAELDRSDDTYVRTRSVPGVSVLEPNVMEIIIGAQTRNLSPATLRLTIESKIDHPSGIASVRVWNWSSNEFEHIGSYPIGMTEESVIFTDIDATNRVRASDRRIEVSVRHVVAAVVTPNGFVSSFDQVEIETH